MILLYPKFNYFYLSLLLGLSHAMKRTGYPRFSIERPHQEREKRAACNTVDCTEPVEGRDQCRLESVRRWNPGRKGQRWDSNQFGSLHYIESVVDRMVSLESNDHYCSCCVNLNLINNCIYFKLYVFWL